MITLRIVDGMPNVNQNMKRLLNEILRGVDTGMCPAGTTWSPPTDVYETAEAFLVLAEVPGLKPDEIEVVVDRTRLRIAGCRRHAGPALQMRVHQMEIGHGRFERTFRLPVPIRPEEATATVDQGLVTIILPKDNVGRTTVEVR